MSTVPRSLPPPAGLATPPHDRGEATPVAGIDLRTALRPSTILIAAFAALSAFEPTLALRQGAVVCVVAAVLRLLKLTVGWLDWVVITLTLLALSSLGWTQDASLTTLTAVNYAAVAAIFCSVRAVVTTLSQVAVVAAGYLVGCLAAAVLLFRQNRDAVFVAELTTARLSITGLNPNYLSYSLATGVVLAVVLLSFRRLRPFAIGGLVLVGWAMLQSGSRGALLAVALLAVWVGLVRLAPVLFFRLLLGAAVAAAAAIVTGVSDRVLVAVDASSVRATGDLAGRLVIWPLAREIFAEHPWFGIGAGGFAGRNTYGIGAHNAPLELGTGLGVAGLALFGLVLWGSLVRSSRRVPAGTRSLLFGGLILTWTPIYLSGHWELSPAAWLVLALFSRLGPLLSSPEP